jgi:hypothetical protein
MEIHDTEVDEIPWNSKKISWEKSMEFHRKFHGIWNFMEFNESFHKHLADIFHEIFSMKYFMEFHEIS